MSYRVFNYLMLILVVTMINISISGNIKEHYAMHEAYDVLSQADEHTLVLFDIDDTLIMPVDNIHLRHFSSKNPGKEIITSFEQKVASELDDMRSRILLQAPRKLIEPDMVDVIKALQLKGVKVIGLTKMGTGTFGVIKSLAEYRSKQLAQFGIEFYKSYDKNIEFTQFATNEIDTPGIFNGMPGIFNGTIMAGYISKGLALSAFIDCLDFIPTQVIFFDDWIENVMDVYHEMRKRGIKFYGYHYRAVEKEQGQLNCTLVQFQYDHLYEHHVWLSAEEALGKLVGMNT